MSTSNPDEEITGSNLDELFGDDLPELELEELDDLFTDANAPEPDELDGLYIVRWLASAANNMLPGPVKALKRTVSASTIFPWKGMEFDTTGKTPGTNLLIGMENGIRWFNFEIAVESSEFDGGECLLFDYDTRGNLPITKKLRDEVRRLNPGLYLGRGNIIIAGSFVFLGYFSLEP